MDRAGIERVCLTREWDGKLGRSSVTRPSKRSSAAPGRDRRPAPMGRTSRFTSASPPHAMPSASGRDDRRRQVRHGQRSPRPTQGRDGMTIAWSEWQAAAPTLPGVWLDRVVEAEHTLAARWPPREAATRPLPGRAPSLPRRSAGRRPKRYAASIRPSEHISPLVANWKTSILITGHVWIAIDADAL